MAFQLDTFQSDAFQPAKGYAAPLNIVAGKVVISVKGKVVVFTKQPKSVLIN